jgi:hypothetical protein
MTTEKLTDEEKAGLSEEEIAALEEPETDEAALRDIAGDDDDDPNFGEHVEDAADADKEGKGKKDDDDDKSGKGKEGEDNGKAGDGSAVDTAAASRAGGEALDGKGDGKDGDGGAAAGKDAAAAGNAESARAQNIDREFVPILPVEDVTEATKRLEAIKTEKAALQQQHKDGDITIEDLLTKRDSLDEESVNLRLKVERANSAMQHNVEAATQRWTFAQETFFEEHDQYNPEKNPVLWGALDAQVKALGRDPANAHRSSMWFLRKSHELVQAEFKPAAGASAGDGKNAKDGKNGADAVKNAKGKGRPADLSKVPTTLASLPAAASSETGKSEFDHLDALEGMEFETELAKLSAAQQERYLASH